MDALDLIRRLHQHRAWANDQLRAAASALGDEPLHQDFPIGQGSVWKSLLHMYAAEYVWLGALEGDPDATLPGDLPDRRPGNQQGANPITALPELIARWHALEIRWQEYLQTLPPGSLDDIVVKRSTSSLFGKRAGTRRSDVLLHVCTHAHFTTAQVINMLRRCGVENLPDPMLISLARFEQIQESR